VKITFLGTGTSQGVPVITCNCQVCSSLDFRDKRLRTSLHIDIDGYSWVIDSGPDFRQQMLREKIQKLDALLFTHEHKDHTAGMDDIRAYNFSQQKDMPIYGHNRVLNQIQKEFAYVFNEVKYPGVPSVILNEIDNQPFQVNGISILPIEVMHYRLPVYGFRIGDFTYITDANYIADEELEKIKGTKVLVLNALQHTHHISHFTLQQAQEIVKKVKPEKAYFTHISHNLGRHADTQASLPEGVFLAYDGLKVNID
jgi:phosphoribosyl 1,2-cyclic phosphate phosphodiesterase